MATIELAQSRQSLQWSSVWWSQLGRNHSLFLLPGEAWHDRSGLIRFFSMSVPNGGVMNVKLFPRSDAADIFLRISADWLVDLGLDVIGSTIYSGDRIVVNVALELGKEFAGISIRDYLQNVRTNNLAYFDVATGEEWFGEPLKL